MLSSIEGHELGLAEDHDESFETFGLTLFYTPASGSLASALTLVSVLGGGRGTYSASVNQNGF